MKSVTGRALLGGAVSAVLIVGIAWAAMPQKEQVYFSPPQPISAMMLPCPKGWTFEDRALGETEFVVKQVEKLLAFDQAFFRVYRREGWEIGVYVAYWKPGGMDPWLIALHTPDICWVGNGAKLVQSDNNHTLGRAGQSLQPSHFRIFDWPGNRQEVIYWHLYGGQPSGFPLTNEAHVSSRWREFQLTMRNTMGGRVRKEQVFVRVSTNRTIDELSRSDLWPMLCASLQPTGLVQPAR